MAQQTAVEWLIEKIQSYQIEIDMYNSINIDIPKYMIEQAKEMEKLQIINAFKTGEYNSVDYFNAEYPHQETSENYYNETYNK
jgi:hypothetical protein